jgi:hypothetical protein
LNGRLHREDGPAIEYADGTKEWYLNDRRHREDGPAIEYADGSKEWYLNDRRHREDGPAVEWADGEKEWYINGVEIILSKNNLIETPETEDEMISLINELKFVKVNGECMFIKQYLKYIDWFYNKYRLLF